MIVIRQRGKFYHLDGQSHALRGTLRTNSRQRALYLSHRIETALALGPDSDIWAELRPALPAETFARISKYAGVQPKVAATWKELRDLFVSDQKKRLRMGEISQQTIDNYEKTLNIVEAFLVERRTTMVKDIDRAIVDDFYTWRLDHVKSRQRLSGRPSLYFDLSHLHRVLTFACQRGLLETNPLAPPKRPRLERHNARPFSADEVSRLETAARQSSSDQLLPSADKWLPFWLLRYTGLRPNDAISLQWREVDLCRRRIVHACHKNHKVVNIPLHPDDDLLSALEAEYKYRKPLPDETVLLNPHTGRAFTYDQLYDLIVKLGDIAGVRDATPYRLRGTFAVDMLIRTNSIYAVAKYLGNTIKMVERHYSPFVDELQEHARSIAQHGAGLKQFVTTTSQQERTTS